MNSQLVLATLAGFFFGAWPLIMRLAGNINPGWSTTLVAFGTLGVSVYVFQGSVTPSLWAIMIGIIAGALNGLGLIFYSKIIGAKFSLFAALPLVMVMGMLFGAFGAVLFYGEAITTRKLLGVIAAMITAILLA